MEKEVLLLSHILSTQVLQYACPGTQLVRKILYHPTLKEVIMNWNGNLLFGVIVKTKMLMLYDSVENKCNTFVNQGWISDFQNRICSKGLLYFM